MFFIANDDIYTLYNDTIKEAENYLFIVTPWYQPNGHLKSNIESALQNDIVLHLITRPKDIGNLRHKKSIEELEEFVKKLGDKTIKKEGGFLGIGSKKVETDRLQITYVPELHAKMVIADKKMAVLSSSNIIENSLSNNFEAGILIDVKQEDYECNNSINFLEEALSYVEMIEQKFSNTQIPYQVFEKCASCGKPLWNPHHKLCLDCYKLNNQNANQSHAIQRGKCKTCKFSYHNGGNKCPIEIHRKADGCTYHEVVYKKHNDLSK